MTRAMEFSFLEFLPKLFLYAALQAWSLAFAGLLHDLWRRLSRSGAQPASTSM
jgi:hypothetical protein